MGKTIKNHRRMRNNKNEMKCFCMKPKFIQLSGGGFQLEKKIKLLGFRISKTKTPDSTWN